MHWAPSFSQTGLYDEDSGARGYNWRDRASDERGLAYLSSRQFASAGRGLIPKTNEGRDAEGS
jgi:hypothetical protein